MGCPYCQGDATQELERMTALGYRLFRCRPCRRTFNERTGTPFNHLQVPTDIALLVVLWRLRYKLSLRDLAEMFLTRGFTFTHETVREWEERFAPLLTERLRAKRRGKAGKKWHADETYVKVDGRWCYLYRAIDAEGNLVDSMLSETRDMDAAKRFFTRARTVVGHAPEKVTTDGHDAYPRAIREILGPHDFSSWPPHINTELAASKAPKSQIKRCCWRTLRYEFQSLHTACGHACYRLADEAPLRFASSIIKSGTYNNCWTLRLGVHRADLRACADAGLRRPPERGVTDRDRGAPRRGAGPGAPRRDLSSRAQPRALVARRPEPTPPGDDRRCLRVGEAARAARRRDAGVAVRAQDHQQGRRPRRGALDGPTYGHAFGRALTLPRRAGACPLEQPLGRCCS